MTLDSLLQWATVAVFTVLGGLTLAQSLRARGRGWVDIAVVFGSLAAALLLQEAALDAHLQFAWLTPLELTVIAAHPYLMLRLVEYFRPVSKPVQILSVAGTALSIGAIWFAPGSRMPLVIGMLAFPPWLEGYVTVAFARQSLRTGGVTHWRYLHAAVGAGLLTIAFALGIVIVALPSIAPATMVLIRVLVALAGLSFCFGFAPPSWLRQVWQFWELHRLVDVTPDALRQTDTNAILGRLCEASMRAVGGESAAFVAWNDPASYLDVRLGRGEIPPPGTPITEGAIVRAWKTRVPGLAARASDSGLQDWYRASGDQRRALYAVPIVTPEVAWGVLVVFLARRSLFAVDNLELLTAFCGQIATELDYASLVRNQRALIDVLDTRSGDLLETNKELSREIQIRKQAEEDLESANRELEAFSYSVSHDLRAPLRHISGFASLLQRSPSAAALDDTSQRRLTVIIESVGRMGTLIDDLLAFSRVGRVEMHTTQVPLDEMVRKIQAELSEEERAGELVWTIHPLPTVCGDAALLRQVFVNLLSNAVKYTRTRPRAEIEIGWTDAADEVVIFVRDNGVGFDMAYVDKLFGVFQRLHRIEEFEGTGVGLANVKRVIGRHGGRAWAEGVIDQGAVFYISLPKRQAGASAASSASAQS